MAENPAQANIQGVEIHLVEKNNNGQTPAAPEDGCKITVGEAALPTNPE